MIEPLDKAAIVIGCVCLLALLVGWLYDALWEKRGAEADKDVRDRMYKFAAGREHKK